MAGKKAAGFLISILLYFWFCNVLMGAIAATIDFDWKISSKDAILCTQAKVGELVNKPCRAGPSMHITEGETLSVNITNSLSSNTITTGCHAITVERYRVRRILSERPSLHTTQHLLQPGQSYVDRIQVARHSMDMLLCVAHMTWIPHIIYRVIVIQSPPQQRALSYGSPVLGEWWNAIERWDAAIEHGLATSLVSETRLSIPNAPTTNELRGNIYVYPQGGANQENLSTYIWENSVDLLARVYDTTYIKGVIDGDMDPNFYGAYTMQDAAWCREISIVWGDVAANQSAPQELRDYANRSMTSYLSCSQFLFDAFTIKDNGGEDYGVVLGTAATNYANVVRSATSDYGSEYIMIATYACAKLWSNITANLSTMVNSSNPYSLWVYNNTGNSSAIRQANFIDNWATEWYDWTLSLSIFRNAMLGEIGLFNLATTT